MFDNTVAPTEPRVNFSCNGLYLGYFTTPDTGAPTITYPAWTVTTATNCYVNSYKDSTYNGFYVEIATSGWQNTLFNNYANLCFGSQPVGGSATRIGIRCTGTLLPASNGGIKPAFYNSSDPAVCFASTTNPLIVLSEQATIGTCQFTGYWHTTSTDPAQNGPNDLHYPADPIRIIYRPSASSSTPAQFWTDVNAGMTYANLWSTYPTVMPNVAQTVYTMRELPGISTAVSGLGTGITGISTSVSNASTASSGKMDALNTTLGTVKTSLDDASTASQAKQDTLNTNLADNTIALTTQTTSLGDKFDTLYTGLTAQITAISAIGTAFDASFGPTGNVAMAIDGLAVPTTNLGAILTAISGGATRAQLQTTYPLESVYFAQEIDTLLNMAPDQRNSAILTALSNMGLGHGIIAQLQSTPELIQYTDLAFLDKLMNTGMYPS